MENTIIYVQICELSLFKSNEYQQIRGYKLNILFKRYLHRALFFHLSLILGRCYFGRLLG